MPAYVLLSRLSSQGQREIAAEPEKLKQIRGVLEQWEANILADYQLLGEYDHCTVFEVSDNFRAQTPTASFCQRPVGNWGSRSSRPVKIWNCV